MSAIAPADLSPVGVVWNSVKKPTAVDDHGLKPNTCVWNVAWNQLRAEGVNNPSSAQTWQRTQELVAEYNKKPTAGAIHNPDHVTKQQLDGIAKLAKEDATKRGSATPPATGAGNPAGGPSLPPGAKQVVNPTQTGSDNNLPAQIGKPYNSFNTKFSDGDSAMSPDGKVAVVFNGGKFTKYTQGSDGKWQSQGQVNVPSADVPYGVGKQHNQVFVITNGDGGADVGGKPATYRDAQGRQVNQVAAGIVVITDNKAGKVYARGTSGAEFEISTDKDKPTLVECGFWRFTQSSSPGDGGNTNINIHVTGPDGFNRDIKTFIPPSWRAAP